MLGKGGCELLDPLRADGETSRGAVAAEALQEAGALLQPAMQVERRN